MEGVLDLNEQVEFIDGLNCNSGRVCTIYLTFLGFEKETSK